MWNMYYLFNCETIKILFTKQKLIGNFISINYLKVLYLKYKHLKPGIIVSHAENNWPILVVLVRIDWPFKIACRCLIILILYKCNIVSVGINLFVY